MLDSTHFVVTHASGSSSYHPYAVVSTVSSGTTITPGTPVTLSSVASYAESVAALDSTHFVVAYQNNISGTPYPIAVVPAAPPSPPAPLPP